MMNQMTAPASPGAGQPMPTDQGPSPQPTPEGGAMGGMQQATPEEQAQYDQIVGSAFNMVYDDKMLPKIVKTLEGGGDPKAGLARAASLVVLKIVESAEKSGKQLAPDVLFHAGTEIFEDLANLSSEAGIHNFAENPDDLEGAYFLALDQIRVEMQETGKLSPEMAGGDMAALQEMNATGELENMMISLAQRDDQSRGEQAPGQKEQPQPGSRGGLIQQGAM
jgi:hypothetical protein